MKRTGRDGRPRWALMERFVVPNLDEPTENYLTRWRLIETPWGSIYLHRMDGPDSRPTLHDHPWNFLSIVLRGGYVERRLDPMTREVDEAHRVTTVNHMRTHDAHAIVSLLRVPSWTLVLVGARRRTWGYSELSAYGTDSEWVWTEFDKHRHNDEFVSAMQQRKASQ